MTAETVKYTLGPWRTETWACHAPTTILVGEKRVIAECSGNGEYTDEECLANARLIAAAPDMLEALESFLAYISSRVPGEKSLAYLEAEAAIRKAKG